MPSATPAGGDMNAKSRVVGLKRNFTILEWLPHYKSEWLRYDVIAALSVWALLVPQGIAYSSIAGVPASTASTRRSGP